MLKIGQLRDYAADVMVEIPEIKSSQIVVTVDELMKFLNDHTPEMNTLMLSLVPGHRMSGDQDSAKWDNMVGFYFLEKTDYSQYDHPGFLNVFERTQLVAEAFVHKLILDKSMNTGIFCGFLAWLDENSISVSPIKGLNSCNGWYVEITMKSNV